MLVSSSAAFQNVSFSQCTTAWNGGAIAVAAGAVVSLAEVTMTACEADLGGAIFLETSSSIHVQGPSRLAMNVARNGGAIHGSMDSEILITGRVLLVDNDADVDGGGVYTVGGSIQVRNGALLQGNTARQNGGAISANGGGTVVIENNVTLLENSAGVYGGVISVLDGGVQVSNHVSFHDNTASGGGAIYVRPGAVVINGKVEFSDHFVTGHGSVLLADAAASVHVDGNALIRNNIARPASGGRGAFAGFNGVTMAFRNGVLFESNSAFRGACAYAENGGEILMEGGVTARNNDASSRGGVISTFASITVTIQDSVLFDNNRVSGAGLGGSIYVAYSDEATNGLTVRNGVTMSRGSAVYGGAVYGRDSKCYFGNDVNITDGYSYSGGGAVYLFSLSSIEIEGPARFSRNYGYYGGTFHFLQYVDVIMRGDVLVEGSSGANG